MLNNNHVINETPCFNILIAHQMALHKELDGR